MLRVPSVRLLVAVLAASTAAFVGLTVVVASSSSLRFDAGAFRIADALRAPWLDHAARVLTTLGLLAIVAPVLLIGAAFLVRHRHPVRATSLIVGAALTSIGVWITKAAVDRARPPAPLVHTAGRVIPLPTPPTLSAGWPWRSR